jgi:hypothetical protein
LVQADRLTMVYGTDDGGYRPVPGCARPENNGNIAMAYSTDGINWSGRRVLFTAVQPWEGAIIANGRHIGNVGTPTINQYAGTTYIGYHGFSNTAAVQPYVQRGFATYPGTDTTHITSASIVRHANPMVFTRQDGSPENRHEFSIGYGEADIIKCASDCGDDENFYMVVEGFDVTPFCSATDGGPPYPKIVIAMAQAPSPAGPWKVQDHVLLGARERCGRDMPSWQYLAPNYRVILTQGDRTGLQRLNLTNQ